MPIGFSKAIFSKTVAAAAAAPSSYRAFTGSGEPNSGNMASFRWSGMDFTTDDEVSMVMWFRANGTGWLDGTESYLITLNSSTTGSQWARLSYTSSTFGWQLQLLEGANAYVDGRGYGNTSAQASDSFDGSWKCAMVYLNSNGASNNTANRAIYINDTDYTNLPTGFPTGDWTAANYDGAVLRYSPNNNTGSPTYQQVNEVGSGFEMGPIWIYNGKVDFHTQSVRRRYYDPANTDGFVSPSTDGTTTAGATQPDIFAYHNGSTLVNGGSDTITISQTSVGTGSITVIPTTEGPGSGDTI